MKKIFLPLLFCFVLAFDAAAQDLRIGFQASPTVSWLTSDARTVSGNGSSFPGLKLGLVGQSGLASNENYAFTWGLGFAFNHGGSLIFDDGGRFWTQSEVGETTFGNNATLDYSLQYVEVPLGLKLSTPTTGFFTFAIEPQLSLGARIKAQGDIDADGISVIEDINIKEEVNPFFASLGIGVTTDYEIATNTILNAGIIYQNILSDITKEEADMDTKTKMHVIAFRLAIIL